MDTPLDNFVLKAEYKANEISGRWSTDERSNGTWECKKVIEGASVHYKRVVDTARLVTAICPSQSAQLWAPRGLSASRK